MSLRLALVTALLLLQGCLFAPEEEDAAIKPAEQVDVVPEGGPFDPSKALEDTGPGELEESGGEEQPQKTEEVASEAEAEALEESAERTVERINESAGEDDQAKAAVAANPPPEDPGSGERWSVTLLDWTMELAVILVLALALSLPCWLVLRLLAGSKRMAGRARAARDGANGRARGADAPRRKSAVP